MPNRCFPLWGNYFMSPPSELSIFKGDWEGPPPDSEVGGGFLLNRSPWHRYLNGDAFCNVMHRAPATLLQSDPPRPHAPTPWSPRGFPLLSVCHQFQCAHSNSSQGHESVQVLVILAVQDSWNKTRLTPANQKLTPTLFARHSLFSNLPKSPIFGHKISDNKNLPPLRCEILNRVPSMPAALS